MLDIALSKPTKGCAEHGNALLDSLSKAISLIHAVENGVLGSVVTAHFRILSESKFEILFISKSQEIRTEAFNHNPIC